MESKSLSFINPQELFNPEPYGFSHSVAVESPFKLCFISGQSGGVGKDHVLSDDFRNQVQEALKNLKIVLSSHAMTIADVVKITLLIVEHSQDKLKIWEEEARAAWGGAPFPTSTLIPVGQLALPRMLFEIEATAVKLG